MMISAVRTQVSPIGLVFDAHEFRAVQLVRARGGDRVLASAIFPRRDAAEGRNELTSDELRWAGELLSRRGFVGPEVVLLPKLAWCSSHIFELPPVGNPQAKAQIARVEVAREKKCTPADFELALWDLPAKGRTQESMVVSCNRAMLNAALDTAEEAGFMPVGVDLPEQALSRVLDRCTEDHAITGVLHIGWGESLAVIKNEGAVVYIRRINHGLGAIHTRIREQYTLGWGETSRVIDRMLSDELHEHERAVRGMWVGFVRTIVGELDVAIRYVSHTYRAAELGSVALGGYGATHSDLHSTIDEVLGMPAFAMVPAVMIESGVRDAVAARLAMPYGLAGRWDEA